MQSFTRNAFPELSRRRLSRGAFGSLCSATVVVLVTILCIGVANFRVSIASGTSARGIGDIVENPIDVLHVSIIMQDELLSTLEKSRSDSAFRVTQLALADFNRGEPVDLSEYDVVVFGLSDGYESEAGLWIGRLGTLRSYITAGGGVVWTHDSLECGALGADAEETAGILHVSPRMRECDPLGGEELLLAIDHPLLHYPHELGAQGSRLDCLATHTNGGEVSLADVVVMFADYPASACNFYLTANSFGLGRVVVTEIGHSYYDNSVQPRELVLPAIREAQLFVNSLVWAASRS